MDGIPERIFCIHVELFAIYVESIAIKGIILVRHMDNGDPSNIS